ncbi:peptidoglycan-binding domain-containing protein [Glycomyces artemisiae]|uniref:Putative peptidoglycan binding protein n=1 Tax=Glycomyces artemisiae TaxID=1076443 RepID=A0A2T0UEQ4_9ACTN|nr:peptidoglycan-binding protein [Glycomyces artemisiae]PRY56425.1 putative peptidoglycan binding protein [Glycomyces artemisiae]
MSIYRGPYYSANKCSGFARPGNKALMSWYLGAYGDRGAANLGIYVCKSLGSGISIHGDGRACDLGTAPYNRPGSGWPAWGWALANALRLNSAELGIQLIIFNGKVWSCRYPDSGWRDYDGSDPHDGHLHVELTPSSAASLTVAKIQSIIGGGSSPITIGEDDMIGLKRGDEGEEVKALQYVLADAGFDPGEKDGQYGPKVAAALLAARRSLGSSATDGDNLTAAAYAQLLRALIKKQAPATTPPSSTQVAAAVAAYLKANPVKLPENVQFSGGTLTGVKAK